MRAYLAASSDRAAPAELTLARHLARAVEDLLTVAPIELALTETMGVTEPRPPRPGPSANPKVRDFPPGTGIPPGISGLGVRRRERAWAC